MQTVKRAKSRKSRKNILNRELRKDLGKKLVGYSAVAGAVLTIGTGVAEAIAMKTTLGTPETIGLGEYFNLDIDGDDINDFYFRVLGFTGVSFFYSAFVAGGETNGITYTNPYSNEIVITGSESVLAQNLILLDPINAALSGWTYAYLGLYALNDGGTSSNGNFLGSRGFLGVSFGIGSSDHYGWVDVGLNDDASEITIYAYGYNDAPDTEIGAGEPLSEPVPEPATLVTLAMGAAGLYAWRRNRKRKSVNKQNNNQITNDLVTVDEVS